MRKILVLSLLILACGAMTLRADPVPVGSSEYPTGIRGLVSDGITYDVEFKFGSFVDFWGDPTAPSPVPTFWHNGPDALSAAQAIQSVLVANGALGVSAANDPTVSTTDVVVPYQIQSPGWVSMQLVTYEDIGSGWQWDVLDAHRIPFDETVLGHVPAYLCADFSPVPLPGAALLGILGLGAAGFHMRCKER